MITVHGILNCDTVKKACRWLDACEVIYAFRDFKKLGVDEAALRRWVNALGWEMVLNRAGTTFRTLPAADRANLDADKAIALMRAQPSMIRRPIVEGDGILLAGFKPEIWDTALA